MEEPAPCVLLAHTFQHQELRDHVDEIRFTEPVLVTTFEILDFRKSSSSAAISLLGETRPSTFTLEMYFHVRGEPRFRPLCPPFLYSASKPSPVDIQVCVTDHMVIRGIYSAITLVIFGNPVRDLNLKTIADCHEYDVYSGISNLRPQQQVKTDELKKLVSELLSLATPKSHTAITMAALSYHKHKGAKESLQIISEAAEENGEIEVKEENHALNVALRWISDGLELKQQVDTFITGLAAVQLLCMDRHCCCDFIAARGISLLVHVLRDYSKESSIYTALALQTFELCSRYAFGCDAILACEDKSEKTKLGYATLLSALVQAQRPFIAHLSAEVLHRLRIYELASIFQAAVDSLLMDTPGDKKQIKKVLVEAVYSLQRLTNVLLLKDDVTSSLNVNRFMNMEFEDESLILDDLSDEHISTLLQERRIIPAVVALLSSPHFCYEENMHMYVNLIGTAQKLILSLLSSPSGNILLAIECEAVSAMISAFNNSNHESVNMRQLAVMVNQELVFHPQEITKLLAKSLTVLSTFDRLLASTSSKETLWCLRTLAKSSRAQTTSTVLQRPELLYMVIEIIEDCAASDSLQTNETLLASLHYATQILYGLLTDTMLSTWTRWIPHAAKMRETFQILKDSEIYEILEDSEHIAQLYSIVDVAIVYQSEGALGLLKFASSISGGDSNEDQPDACKILEKMLAYSTGYSMVLQLTCCMQILASVCSSSIAASLIGEGAVGIITVFLECCASVLQEDMLDQDYDINMNDYTLRLLLPTLLLLSTLCARIQREGIQYRNTKLANLLLRLHRILSGKQGAYVTCPPYTWNFGGAETAAVLRCLASVLAFWPVCNWESSFAQSRIFPSSLPVDPIETCSSLILLADFLPSENIYKDKRGIYRNSLLESILGTNVIPQVNWHTHSPFKENILQTFVPHLGEVVLRLSSTTCTMLIDWLKVVIIRISCASADHAATVLRPLIAYISEEVFTNATDADSLREECCIKFITELASHPASKAVLLREEIVRMICEKISSILPFKEYDENIPASFRSLLEFLIKTCDWIFPLSFEDCCRIASLLNSLLKELPLGDEFEVLTQLFETFSTHRLGRAALIAMFNEAEENNKESVKPLLILTKRLCTALNEDRNAIGGCCSSLLQVTHASSYAMLKLAAAGKSFLGLGALKLLFGYEQNTEDSAVLELINVINRRLNEGSFSEDDQHKAIQTKGALEALTRLLQRSIQQGELLVKVQAVANVEFRKNHSDPLMRLVPEVNLENSEISYASKFGNSTENFMWEYSAEVPKCTLRNPKRKAAAYTNVRKRKKMNRAESAHERGYPLDEFMLRQQKNKTREDPTDDDEPRAEPNGLTSTKEAVNVEHDKDTMVYPVPSQAFAIPGITMTDPNHHLQQISQMVQLQTQHSQLYQQVYQSTPSLQPSIQQIYQPPPPPQIAPQESLQHILSSPESIQELLKDQTRLTRLLEEHPKLLSLLQEKLQL